MEELKFNLIVFHPYRPLQLYISGGPHSTARPLFSLLPPLVKRQRSRIHSSQTPPALSSRCRGS